MLLFQFLDHDLSKGDLAAFPPAFTTVNLDADETGVEESRFPVDQGVLEVRDLCVPNPDLYPGRLTLYPDSYGIVFMWVPVAESLKAVLEEVPATDRQGP